MLHTYYEYKYNHQNILIEKTFYKTALIINNKDLVNGEIPLALLQKEDAKYTSLDVRNTNIRKIPQIDHITELIACNCINLTGFDNLKKCITVEFAGCTSLEILDLSKLPKLQNISLYRSGVRHTIDGKISGILHDGNIIGTHSQYYKIM